MTIASNSSPNNSDGPSPFAMLGVYIVLGGLISFLLGREPGTLPDNICREMAPVVIVICGFITSYSLWDVMTVGHAKNRAQYTNKLYQDWPPRLPEDVHLAVRVQTNQVEQMPGFLVGSLCCALLVNGTVAGIMALAWAILRRWYATVYRGAVGVPLAQIGLTRFTLPAYMLLDTMLMASAVQALRCLFFSPTSSSG